MNIETYQELQHRDSIYKRVNISNLNFDDEYISITDDTSFNSIYINETLKDSLCRYVGISSSINKGLLNVDKDLWKKVLTKLYKYHNKEEILLLLSEEAGQYSVKGISQQSRDPIMSNKFINTAIKFFEVIPDVEIFDIEYNKNSVISTITILSSNTYTSYNNRKIRLGVLLSNDETLNTTCRLVFKYEDGETYYLPSKFYNLSSSRYDRYTKDSNESLNMLLLRVSEDFTEGSIEDKVNIILNNISKLKDKNISYIEFNSVKLLLSKMCTLSDFSEEDIESVLSLLEELNDFEDLYLEKENDYIWRCTAFSNNTILDLLNICENITKEYVFYPEYLLELRDLLGDYLMTPRMCQHIAKRI